MRRARCIGVLGLLTVAALLGASCGSPEATDRTSDSTTTTAVASDELLYVGTDSGIAALDPEAGSVEFHTPGAVPAGDWSVLWHTTPSQDGGTQLVPVNPLTGDEGAGDQHLDGSFEARVVAHDGRAVALTPPRTSGISTYLPEGREKTTIVVARSDGTSQRFDLDGNFEPEAFSLDTRSLFVVQYFPAAAPDRYQVRRLDLDTGEVAVVFDLDDKIQGEMGGVARTHVRAPDGKRLYTLYTVPGPDPKAFIHVVSLEDRWAHCVDLPVNLVTGTEATLALTITPDGRELIVADQLTGLIAVMDTAELAVTRTGAIDPSSEPAPAVAATDGETLYLATNAEIEAVDLAELEVRQTWKGSASSDLRGATLSTDGRRLYVGDGMAIVEHDSATGEVVRTIRAPAVSYIAYVGRNSSPVPIDLSTTECAC